MAPILDRWLGKHHAIRDSIIWEYSTPLPAPFFSLQRAQPYKNWKQRDKDALQTAFNAAWNFTSIDVEDVPPNVVRLRDGSAPTTALSPADAHSLYLASVGQSLAAEIGNRVAWSVANYSSESLAVLFDSREFFVWNEEDNGYRIHDSKGGHVVPASPHTMYDFLRDNDLIGPHRLGTIVRMLTWCHHNLHHHFGPHTAKNCVDVWQYRGEAPVLRTIQGTMDQANPSYGVRCWTAGCHGTAGFLRAVLRTVNIPVVHQHQCGHALPYFSADGLHLSHGDDPYNHWTYADPPYSMFELLMDQSKFDEWFGSDVPNDARKQHVGKRVTELAIQYLPTAMLLHYCNDQAAGKSHADGEVYAAFEGYGYTLAQLEKHQLWTRMDAKITGLGGCDHVDAPTFGPHRLR